MTDDPSHSVAVQTDHRISCNVPLWHPAEEEVEKTAPETLVGKAGLDAVHSSSMIHQCIS